MVHVRIPTPLRKLTQGQEVVSVASGTLREVIDALEASYPGLKGRLVDEAGKQRRFVNLFVGEEDVRFLNQLDTEIKDGAEVSIVPAIAGG